MLALCTTDATVIMLGETREFFNLDIHYSATEYPYTLIIVEENGAASSIVCYGLRYESIVALMKETGDLANAKLYEIIERHHAHQPPPENPIQEGSTVTLGFDPDESPESSDGPKEPSLNYFGPLMPGGDIPAFTSTCPRCHNDGRTIVQHGAVRLCTVCRDLILAIAIGNEKKMQIGDTRYACPDPCDQLHTCERDCVTGHVKPTEPMPKACKELRVPPRIPGRTTRPGELGGNSKPEV